MLDPNKILTTDSMVHKIIIAGLDSVGKTSIYKKMIEGMDVEDIKDLSPTKGIHRISQVIMDHQVVFWDLGGQEVYRAQHIRNPKTFENSALLVYVLDVQDIERFDQSLEYLHQILMVVKNLESPPRIFLLMHKFDPDKIGELKENFLEASKIFKEVKKIPSLNVSRFPTSIYSENLDFAFKKIIQNVVPDYTNPFQDLFLDEEGEEVQSSAEDTKGESEVNDFENTDKREISGEDGLIAGLEVNIDKTHTTAESLKSELILQFEQALESISFKKKYRDKFK